MLTEHFNVRLVLSFTVSNVIVLAIVRAIKINGVSCDGKCGEVAQK